MRTWQKAVLGFFSLVLLGIIGASAYVAKSYYELKATAVETYQSVDRISKSKRVENVDYSKLDPISILLLGVDTNDTRTAEGDSGRTDSIIVATINPQKGQTTLVSIPRDTLVDMECEYDGDYITYDKINAAYAYGGAPLAIDTVEKLLDIPIDHYATVNMDGMADLIEAVGGVDVKNDIDFTLNGEHFAIGDLHLNGKRAVEWARMREEDPKGDYGRQERQRIVLQKVFDKIASVETLSNYQNLLDVIGKNGKTDLEWNTIKTLAQKYTPALKSFKTDQLQGDNYTGDGNIGYSGISYQEVTSDELLRVQNLLKDQLNLPQADQLNGNQYVVQSQSSQDEQYYQESTDDGQYAYGQ